MSEKAVFDMFYAIVKKKNREKMCGETLDSTTIIKWSLFEMDDLIESQQCVFIESWDDGDDLDVPLPQDALDDTAEISL